MITEPEEAPDQGEPERTAVQVAVDAWWRERELVGVHVRAQLLTVRRIEQAERGELEGAGTRTIPVNETHTWHAGAP